MADVAPDSIAPADPVRGAGVTNEEAAKNHLSTIKGKLTRCAYDTEKEWLTVTSGHVCKNGRCYNQSMMLEVRDSPHWRGSLPVLRELIQNAGDYLELTGEDGLLKPHIERVAQLDKDNNPRIAFSCADCKLFAIEGVGDDELVLSQWQTFPLHPGCIRMGVVDLTKANGRCAGGWGEGFKMAIAANLHFGGAIGYHMTSDSFAVKWDFMAKEQKSNSASIAPSRELVCRVDAKPASPRPDNRNKLVIKIRRSGIVGDFVANINLFTMFWDANRDKGIFPSGEGCPNLIIGNRGTFETSAKIASALEKHWAWRSNRCHPGIYIRGLYVSPPPFSADAVLVAGVDGINVSGRDRNHVKSDQLFQAMFDVLYHSGRHGDPLVKQLVAPAYAIPVTGESAFEIKPGERYSKHQLVEQVFANAEDGIGRELAGFTFDTAFVVGEMCDLAKWAADRLKVDVVRLDTTKDYSMKLTSPLIGNHFIKTYFERHGDELESDGGVLSDVIKAAMGAIDAPSIPVRIAWVTDEGPRIAIHKQSGVLYVVAQPVDTICLELFILIVMKLGSTFLSDACRLAAGRLVGLAEGDNFDGDNVRGMAAKLNEPVGEIETEDGIEEQEFDQSITARVLEADGPCELLSISGIDIDSDSTPQQVTRAFRRLSRSIHPDKNSHERASAAFLALSDARDMLLRDMEADGVEVDVEEETDEEEEEEEEEEGGSDGAGDAGGIADDSSTTEDVQAGAGVGGAPADASSASMELLTDMLLVARKRNVSVFEEAVRRVRARA